MTYEKINNFVQKLRNFLSLKTSYENPVYTSIINLSDGEPHRFHLRILSDHTGILTVDASFILYLNQTAAIYVQQWISGKTLEEIKDYFLEEFHTDEQTVKNDFQSIQMNIESLLTQEDVNPVQLGFQTFNTSMHVHEIPLRVYLALTYRYDTSNQFAYTHYQGSKEEIGISQQKSILEKLIELGVPQVTLSGGEPTLLKNYQELIEYGEEKGIVMGLMTNGTVFKDVDKVSDVINKGLDYVIIPVHTKDPKVHENLTGRNDLEEKIQAITNFEKDDIYLETKTTLLPETKDSILETITYLSKNLNVRNIEVNCLINPHDESPFKNGIDVEEVKLIVRSIKKLSGENGFNFNFSSPIRHPQFDPLDYGLGLTNTHAANTSITIEPDGDVLPVQYFFHSPGNILTDKWSKIWYSSLFKKIRKHQIKERGEENDLLTFCGAGIPFSS